MKITCLGDQHIWIGDSTSCICRQKGCWEMNHDVPSLLERIAALEAKIEKPKEAA